MSCGMVKQIQIQRGALSDKEGESAGEYPEEPTVLQSGAGRRGGRRNSRKQMGGDSCGLQARGLPVGSLQQGGSYGEVTVTKTGDMGGLSGYREPMGYQAPTFKHANGSPLGQAFGPVIPPRAVIPVAAAAAPVPEAFQYSGTGGGSASTHRAVHVNLKKHGVSRKVHLKPKRSAADLSEKKLKSRHKTRRITLGLVGLAKRQTRAKKISQKMKEMPLDKLRSELVAKGLIKAHSKAPESILRQIAADAQILAGKGL
jgi:hypothetical protein